jgi:hypothetical protein
MHSANSLPLLLLLAYLIEQNSPSSPNRPVSGPRRAERVTSLITANQRCLQYHVIWRILDIIIAQKFCQNYASMIDSSRHSLLREDQPPLITNYVISSSLATSISVSTLVGVLVRATWRSLTSVVGLKLRMS